MDKKISQLTETTIITGNDYTIISRNDDNFKINLDKLGGQTDRLIELENSGNTAILSANTLYVNSVSSSTLYSNYLNITDATYGTIYTASDYIGGELSLVGTHSGGTRQLIGFENSYDVIYIADGRLAYYFTTSTLQIENNLLALGCISATTYTDSNGPVKPYKSYVAIIKQTGTTTPFETSKDEDTIINISYTRDSNGYYLIHTINSGFTSNKTYVFTNQKGTNGPSFITWNHIDEETIGIIPYSIADGMPIDDMLDTSIEIRVYS